MPRFEPFAGIRYTAGRASLEQVTAPPYDVITEVDRAALLARHPENVVRIDLPVEADGPDRYTEAGTTLEGWLADGLLQVDERPSFTVHRMDSTDDRGRPTTTIGVIGALELSRPGEGGILPHEHTTPKARSDRLDLLRGTTANLSAVWGLSLTKGLTDLLIVDDDPVAHWTVDGVAHTVWRVDDDARVAAIAAAVAEHPVVIADGHHRYETSLAYREERRAAAGGNGGAADATMAYVVELVDDQLTVRPIHRLITAPGGLAALERSLDERFVAGSSIAAPAVADGSVLDRMAAEGALALVRPDGSARLLVPRPEVFAGVADLDSARVAVALEGDARSAGPAVEVRSQHGIDHVVEAVTSGRADAGLLLRPATVAQIQANAHAGERMPPKTTFFHPKPPTGIVIRRLDGSAW